MFFRKKEKLNINSLRPIFETQQKTLLRLDYPALLGMTEEEFNTKLKDIWKTLEATINSLEITIKGSIPLLLVVTIGDLKNKIEKIQGHTQLDIANITTENEHPFSILLDVEDGKNMVAKSPKDALRKFEKEHRHALNINESIALLTHYQDILKDHYVISAGSFYPKDGETLPLLWLLSEHKNPELHYAWFHIAHGSYGSPSYSIKL